MKSIIFRPLRRIKKTGKIAVASYMQWNKVKCANYSNFKLVVSNEYEIFDKSEFVYNHEGELLYHFNYSPWEVFEYHGSCIEDGFDWDYMREVYKSFTLISKDRENKEYKSYHWQGADCCGTPTFSHLTAEQCEQYEDITQFEPLTVGYVIDWFGWFLFQLENSCLQIGK